MSVGCLIERRPKIVERRWRISVQLFPPTTIDACCDEVIRRMSRGVPMATALDQVLAAAKLPSEELELIQLRGLSDEVDGVAAIEVRMAREALEIAREALVAKFGLSAAELAIVDEALVDRELEALPAKVDALLTEMLVKGGGLMTATAAKLEALARARPSASTVEMAAKLEVLLTEMLAKLDALVAAVIEAE